MMTLILSLFALTSMAQTPAKYYQVFRADNEHCFAVDAQQSIYRIDDANFKCDESSKNAQPNPDRLFKIQKRSSFGDITPSDKVNDRKSLVAGDVVRLDHQDGNMFLYKTVKGTINEEPILASYFAKTAKRGDEVVVSVSELHYEYNKHTDVWRPYMSTNKITSSSKLDPLPPVVVATPVKVEDPKPEAPIVAVEQPREIVVQPAQPAPGKPADRVVTEAPPSQIPIITEVVTPPTPQNPAPEIKYVHTVEKEYCSDIFKKNGRRLDKQSCSHMLDQKFIERCILDKHCEYSNGCSSEQCVAQYKEMGALDDVSDLMRKYEQARKKFNKASARLNSAEKKLKDCDNTDDDNAANTKDRQNKAEAVVKAKAEKNKAQAEYNSIREKLDKLVYSKMKSSGDRYACMNNSRATFKYFYDSWIYVLDYHERYFTCLMGDRVDTSKDAYPNAKAESQAADRGPNSAKKKTKKPKK